MPSGNKKWIQRGLVEHTSPLTESVPNAKKHQGIVDGSSDLSLQPVSHLAKFMRLHRIGKRAVARYTFRFLFAKILSY